MVKFLIIRHGYSLSNKDGTFTGQLDIELSQEGYKQAELVSDYLIKNYKIDKIYSSDLSRARFTIKKVSDTLDIPIILSKELREGFCGQWEGLTVDVIKEKFDKDYASWIENKPFAHPTGGESIEQIGERALKKLIDIAKVNDNKTVLIATHGGVIKAMQRIWLNLPTERLSEIEWVTNASLTEVDYQDGKFTIVKAGVCDYLGDMCTAMPKGI